MPVKETNKTNGKPRTKTHRKHQNTTTPATATPETHTLSRIKFLKIFKTKEIDQSELIIFFKMAADFFRLRQIFSDPLIQL